MNNKNVKIKNLINYWLDSSKYDLQIANSLYRSRKYPYVLFFGHLALEKLLKALYIKIRKKHAPYTHNLPYLVKEIGLEMSEEMVDNLADFMEFHIEARYPEDKMKFYKKCNRKFALENLNKIKEIYRWLIKRL